MKTFTKCAAQGDVMFRRVDAIPTGAVKEDKWDRVVAHSETGHNHAFRAVDHVELFREPGNSFVCYLRCESDAQLEHHRAWDTHESILFPPGIYEVRRQREWTPEGLRRVED